MSSVDRRRALPGSHMHAHATRTHRRSDPSVLPEEGVRKREMERSVILAAFPCTVFSPSHHISETVQTVIPRTRGQASECAAVGGVPSDRKHVRACVCHQEQTGVCSLQVGDSECAWREHAEAPFWDNWGDWPALVRTSRVAHTATSPPGQHLAASILDHPSPSSHIASKSNSVPLMPKTLGFCLIYLPNE